VYFSRVDALVLRRCRISYAKLAAMKAPQGKEAASRAQEPSGSKVARQRFPKGTVLWSVFVVSVVAYAVLALLIPPAGTATNANLERVLLLLAVAYVLLSFPAGRWLQMQAEAVDSGFLRSLARVVPLVLCEAAALTGLTVRLAVGSPHYYLFLALALLGMVLHFPKRGQAK
jgi:cation transport ATPase